MSVVIPALNQAKCLPHVLPRIPSWTFEVIIVDGTPSDDTAAITRRCLPEARVVNTSARSRDRAMRAGFAAARGDVVVTMGGDGSNDPAEMAGFVGALLAGADVALGSRFKLGGRSASTALRRRAEVWALTRAVRTLFGPRYSDLCYGYLSFWRDLLPLIAAPLAELDLESAIHIRAALAELHVVEVPSCETRPIWDSCDTRTDGEVARLLRSIIAVHGRPAVSSET